MQQAVERDTFTYETAVWRGVPKFSCLDCPFYVFHNEPQMMAHCRKMGHGREVNGAVTVDQWIAGNANQLPPNVIITLGYLCWNTKVPSAEGALALLEERKRLLRLGAREVYVQVVDNGSSDGTTNAILNSMIEPAPGSFFLRRNSRNLGISVARNQIIDRALEYGSHYVLLLDGDIEVVPLSTYVMTRYLECHPDVGCIGAYSSNYTRERKLATQRLFEIQESRVKKDIHCAWTQYGMFRCEMFRQGIRFDTDGPLGQPGWGFEDDDLCFQMYEKNWGNRYFGGMKYLHRNIRSSWPNLESTGVDLKQMFMKRKDFLLTKWKKRGLDHGKLQAIEGQHLPN